MDDDLFTTPVTGPVGVAPDDTRGLGAKPFELRSTAALATLLIRRPDLRGVYSPADLADEALLWSA